MKTAFPATIVPAILWALAIIATAYILKGSPAFEWVEGGLTGVALTFVVLRRSRASCFR